MADTPGANDGALNGTTAVEVVAAPGASTQRIVKTITIQNRDTAVVTLTLRYLNGASTRQLWKGDLDVGDTLVWSDPLILDETDTSVTAVLAGAAATTNPDFTAGFIDHS